MYGTHTVEAMTTQPLRRNDPCHCGSGRKYKLCCLDKDAAEARAAHARAVAEAPVPSTGDTVSTKRPKHETHQPWKRMATNTHGFQRVSTPRKVGGG